MGNGNIRWQQFFISVLGTAIGVALTFSLNGMRANNKQEQAQRLTAIMVIHDIDNTIEILKSWKQQEAARDTLLKYAVENRDHLDKFPLDTLYTVITDLLRINEDYRFDTSKESIFNSDLDTWQNLGSVKFLDNVQSFFYDRQTLQQSLSRPEWREPIPYEDYLEMLMGRGMLTEEQFLKLAVPFLKEKLYDNHVIYYIDQSNYREKQLDQLLDGWIALNEENKFLMGITDQEMEDYINSFDATGLAVTKRLLTGTWTYLLENRNQEFTFNADHTYSSVTERVEKGSWLYFSGEYKITAPINGTWELKGDTLAIILDPLTADLIVDISNLVPEEGKQDSVVSWQKRYRERNLKVTREMPEEARRNAYKVRLDSSKDKMQWTTPAGKTFYLKRKQE